ncbi:MAG: hypothetical protein ACR2P6_02865 [Gammaproteobacteria bacterium]
MPKVFLRYFAYAVITAGVLYGLIQIAVFMPGGLLLNYVVDVNDTLGTSEFSPVEQLQNLLILLCLLVFVWIAYRDRLRRPLAIGFVALFLLTFVREQDYFLDRYLLDNLWQVLCAWALALSGVYLYRHRKRFMQGWRRSWPSAGLALMMGGFITLVAFAQLAGHEALWIAIMGDSYARVAKVAAEELMELGAYGLIAMGTAEFWYAWSKLPQTRSLESRPRRHREKRRSNQAS